MGYTPADAQTMTTAQWASHFGPARLLDMVEGRSKQVLSTWLREQPKAWRDAVEVVAMDGFTGFKTAAVDQLPDAVEVMDPFHVVQLAGDALDRCRQRGLGRLTPVEFEMIYKDAEAA